MEFDAKTKFYITKTGFILLLKIIQEKNTYHLYTH